MTEEGVPIGTDEEFKPPGTVAIVALFTATLILLWLSIAGPAAGVASRAASRVDGQPAGDYLRSSIIDPSAFVVDGFDDGKMPADWADILTEAEIEALVGYLLTLG